MAKKGFYVRKVERKPLWKLEDGVTYSSLSKWLECPEQFSLQWIDGLSKKGVDIPLEFGSVFHQGLEHKDKAPPCQVIGRVCDHYKKYRSAALTNTADRDKLNFLLGLAEVVFPEYCNYWEADDSKLVWLGREEKFSIPYLLPGIGGQEDREILLRGMRDGVYTDEAGELYGIFESKTKSRIEEGNIIANLQYDTQTLMYCLCTMLSTGRYPNQIKYNVIRRPDTYRRKNENTAEYLDRVEADVKKRPEFYFKRYTASVEAKELDKFRERTFNPMLRLFVQWWDSVKKNPVNGRFDSPYHFLNSSALVGKYGKCQMWDAVYGNMQSYHVRKEVFPELEECIQVTWQDETCLEECPF